MIKLIATDMDGTWLNDQKKYDHDLFEKELKIMKERDIKFVVASGNQYENLQAYFPNEADQIFYVAENGALVAKGKQILHTDTLSQDELEEIFEITQKYDYPFIVAGLLSAYVPRKAGSEFFNAMKRFYKKITMFDNFSEIDDQIFKVSFDVPEAIMPNVLHELRQNHPNLGFVSGGATSIDMSQKGMNKAVGLKYLGQHLGISPNEMVAFGDSGNDEGMLEYARHSFATRYALPEAKEAADQVIGSSNDSAVQKEILNLLAD